MFPPGVIRDFSSIQSETFLVYINDSCVALQFLGSSLVGVTYNTRSILDGHAKKRRGTKRVNLTAGPDLIFCASKKSPTVSF